ncbi:MAG: cell division protein SepF [Turicibacter sp.]|nr:cell division protein SepF [Turicibacter sp.]
MSLKNKVKSFIGINEEDFYEEEFELPEIPQTQPTQQTHVHVAPTNVQPVEQPRKSLRAVESPKQTTKGQVAAMNASAMMSKVIIREPKQYSDAQNIADCLKESLPVFVNLQRLDKGEGRRVIDFLSGTIYAIDGDIQRVGNDLFLCTPNTVETDGAVTAAANDELSIDEMSSSS